MGTELTHSFICIVCGGQHDTLPLSYSVKAPLAVTGIPLDDLEKRVVWTPDQCVIDAASFYLRGRIPVRIIGLDEPFIWGVWAKISAHDFARTNDLWNFPGRELEPVYPGYLDTELYPFGNTINLAVSVHTQAVGRRPHFTIADQNHPLAVEQRNGIGLRRVEEIASMILHARDEREQRNWP